MTSFATTDVYVSCAVFALVGIVLGGCFSWITSTYAPNLPYTVCIFFVALVIAVFVNLYPEVGGRSFITDAMFQSDVIVFAFLPILIFGETMNLNWHHVLCGLGQSTLLAGPGAIIGTFLMGIPAKLFFPSWTWNVAFMFGAILSATDPVAVVSLLKTSGASHQLTLLIVGESLLNDGSAMVLFTLFSDIVQGTKATAPMVIIFFLKLALGSCVLGVGIGLFTNRVMRYLDHPVRKTDIALQAFVTVCSAYFSFILAQSTLEISGVLCSSAAGLMLAWLAPPFILHHHTMHQVWSTLEWICNTLIFFFAGIAAGDRLYNYFTVEDLYIVVSLYFLLFLVRSIVVGLLFPFLARPEGTGKGLACSFLDAVFMVWGGLRGALGIALALIVQSSDILPTEQSSKIFIYVAGIVAMTLILNATTAKWVLLKLKLVENEIESHEKRMVLDHIRHRLRERIQHTLDGELQRDLGDYDPKELVRLVRLLQDEDEDLGPDAGNVRDSILVAKSIVAEQRLTEFRRQSQDRTGIQPDLMAYIRTTFLNTVRKRYEEAIETGKIGRASYSSHSLLHSIDIAMDFVRNPTFGLHDWDYLVQSMELPDWRANIALYFDKVMSTFNPSSNLYGWAMAKRERRQIYAVTNFIDAHEFAQRRVHTFLGGTEEESEAMVYVIPEEEQIRWESQMEV